MKRRKQWRHWALAGLSAMALAGNAYGGYGGAAFSPTSLTFPSTPNGSVSAPQTATLTAGYGQITINSTVFTGAFRRTGGTCPETGTVTTPCTIDVVFAPNNGGTGGPVTGSLVVNTSAGAATLALAGQATPVSNVPALNPLGLLALGLGLFGLAWARSRG